MKPTKLLLAVLMYGLNILSPCFAQPTKQWDKRFGGSGSDVLYSLQQTADGGYILGGWSNSEISGDKTEASRGSVDYWIVKTDANGTKQWDKRYGGSNYDYFYSLQQTADGGYILGGSSNSGISGDRTEASQGVSDYWLVKTDANGAKQWDKRFGGSDEDYLSSPQQTADGGYILGGSSNSGISGDKTEASRGIYDYWLVKTDANGVYQWDKRFGGSGTDFLNSLQQTADGGYILGGRSSSGISGDRTEASQGGYDYWLVKTDANGAKQWDKRFGGSDEDYFRSLQQTADGGYILGGYSNSGISGDKTEASRGSYDYWLVKTDANGAKQWDKRFGGNDGDILESLHQMSDGGYILGGYSTSGISGDKTESTQGDTYDYWIVKTDANGNKQWDKRFGGNDGDFLYSIDLTSDGGFILGGKSDSDIGGDKSQASWGDSDYWIVKTTSLGLPIELLSFDATPKKDNNGKYFVRCNWSTATESNNDYFLIQRSKDAINFEQIAAGTINGAGNSSTTLYYSYDDEYPFYGLSYYRLKQVDYDGKYSYSKIVAVYIGEMDIINIAPSPAEKEIGYTIKISETTPAQVKVINVLGQTVINHTETIEKGVTQKKIDISMLASGYYMLSISTEHLGKTEKKFAVK